ncbi:MAG: helix-turn-helix transcriptional regulator [Candidatus Zambryskibacteria bacterium]|nr:helix-turn-helix transcriptional regulator [Candidatus Zambryskibacteria bacterium]
MMPFSKIRAKWMKDPEYRKLHKASAFEFEILKAIIKARAKKKMSQRELAEKIGVKQSALARFESGRSNPTLGFLKKVVSGLGLTVTVK